MQAIAEATNAAPGPRQQVEAGFTAYFDFVAGQGSAFRLLFASGPRRDEQFAEAVRMVEETIAEAIAARIEAPIDQEHRRLLAHALVGLAEGTSRHWLAHGLDLEPRQLAKRIADLAWAGLRGLRPD